MSLTFYTTKKVEKAIRARNVFPEDLMYFIQDFFNKKNEASKIKYVRFTLHDVIEENKHIRRSLEIQICADPISIETFTELNTMLALKFPSLNAFVKLHCEYE
jgi:hypothetical protein